MTPPHRNARFAAIAEVTGAFVGTHLLFRAFKQFSAWGREEHALGLNLSPGVAMATIAVGLIWCRRNARAAYGLQAPQPRPSILVLVGAGLAYVPPLIGFFFLFPTPARAWASYFSYVVATAIGEEMFFRGYMQSRLNEVFGRPYARGQMRYGAGLLITSAFFGLLHVLNPVNYFIGHYSFAWAWGAGTMFVGLGYGVIREKTGSVWPAVVVHGLYDVWVVWLFHTVH